MDFIKLYQKDTTDHVEKKNGLTYLSWAWAWAEIRKETKDISYEIKFFDGKPYVFDEKTGYMVFTSVTIEGEEKTMWLPVMDGANKAMLNRPYTYFVKEQVWSPSARKMVPTGKMVEKTVEVATMFDINKTIMRCLVKNLAMFGLGLHIYAGEDLPESPDDKKEDATEEPPAPDKPKAKPQAKKAEKAKEAKQEEAKKEIALDEPPNALYVSLEKVKALWAVAKSKGIDQEEWKRLLLTFSTKSPAEITPNVFAALEETITGYTP